MRTVPYFCSYSLHGVCVHVLGCLPDTNAIIDFGYFCIHKYAQSFVFTLSQSQSLSVLQAHGCTHAFLWPWEPEKWPAKDMGQQPVPHLVENTFLLYVLNGLLSCTAVLMQPLWSPNGAVAKPKEAAKTGSKGQGNTKAPAKATLELEAPVSIGLLPLPVQVEDAENPGGAAVNCRGAPWNSRA